MKLYKLKLDSKECFAWKINSNYALLSGSLETGFKETNQLVPTSEATLCPPVSPSKIICVALNYKKVSDKPGELTEPLFFLKPPSSICLSSKKVKLPFNLNTWGESELGIIVKKRCKGIDLHQAKSHIFGYTICNDITVENIEGRDHHLLRSKGADNFCPCLEYIDTEFSWENKVVSSYQDNELLRQGSTNDLILNPEKLLAYISKWITLMPGDLLLTGAPPRVRPRLFLKNKSKFRVHVEGFEDLENEFYE